MAIGPIVSHMRAIVRVILSRIHRFWRKFRGLKRRYQLLITVIVVVGLIALFMVLGGGAKAPAGSTLRTVTLQSIGALSGTDSSETALGTVRSVTEAAILAQAGGTVQSVNASIGRSVGAGFVIAELENASQRASVLQAEGAYDAALAARAAVSPLDAETAAANAYRSAFSALDTALQNNVDTFFGSPTPAGPNLLINPSGSDPTVLSRKRAEIDRLMHVWQGDITASTKDTESLINEGESVAQQTQAFIEELAVAANKTDSRATAAQFTALATARASVSGVLTSLASARASFRAGSLTSTASVDASVKSALGTLRLAEANLEKTVVRAPISGTVNFLPIRVGDYVTPLEHVATVAQNGALEIVLFISEESRQGLTVSAEVQVENTYRGVVTSISPALDPVNKQIEVHVAVDAQTPLVNGQSVHVALPTAAPQETISAPAGPLMLPLTAVKLTANARVLFTVVEGRLVAIPVEIGDVHGDRIEITTSIASDTKIVTDARGLSEGQAVNVAGGTP